MTLLRALPAILIIVGGSILLVVHVLADGWLHAVPAMLIVCGGIGLAAVRFGPSSQRGTP